MTRRLGHKSLLALTVTSLLLASSCGAFTRSREPVATGGKYGSGVDLEGLDEKEKKKVEAAEAKAEARGGQQPRPGVVRTVPPPAPGSRAAAPQATVFSNDEGPLGANALVYLRKDYSRLVIEINAAGGKAPRPSALRLLRSRLASVLDKPGGIEILPVKTFDSARSSYTMGEVERLEAIHRKQKSDPRGGKAVIHLLYLNGRVSDAPGAVGIAYRASSAVILPDQIESASTPVVSPERIEQAVTVHEVGHILGLVNIGYRSPRNHEDPEHKGHSRNRGSVMYWAVETLDVANILAGGPPTDFDADDRGDLADRKAGRL